MEAVVISWKQAENILNSRILFVHVSSIKSIKAAELQLTGILTDTWGHSGLWRPSHPDDVILKSSHWQLLPADTTKDMRSHPVVSSEIWVYRSDFSQNLTAGLNWCGISWQSHHLSSLLCPVSCHLPVHRTLPVGHFLSARHTVTHVIVCVCVVMTTVCSVSNLN